MSKNVVAVLVGIVLIVIVINGVLYLTQPPKTTPPPSTTTETPAEAEPTSPPIPTLSQVEIEIASKVETHTVTIKNGALSPASLTIKLHDQVTWENQDQETYTIQGEDWGGVPVPAGMRFTQAFKQAGTSTYTFSDHPGLQGTVVAQ